MPCPSVQIETGYRLTAVTVRKLEFEADTYAFADKVSHVRMLSLRVQSPAIQSESYCTIPVSTRALHDLAGDMQSKTDCRSMA